MGITAEQLWLQTNRLHTLILKSLSTWHGLGESKATGSGLARRDKLG